MQELFLVKEELFQIQ